MQGTIGEIRGFAGNFAPRGTAFAHGQLLQISQNTALFSKLGTMYGGDGVDICSCGSSNDSSCNSFGTSLVHKTTAVIIPRLHTQQTGASGIWPKVKPIGFQICDHQT